MLDYQRVTYFWKHPHVGIVHPRNQLAVVLSVFHDILSSKQRPKVELALGDRVTTTGTLYLTGQHRCQTENKWMSKHVNNCHNPIDT